MRIYVGGHVWSVQGERDDLARERCWTAAHPCQALPSDPSAVRCLLDSGAFSDPPEARLDPAAALTRQLLWERSASIRFGDVTWRAEALVSYDRLIDETWVAGTRHKRRWRLRDADAAVRETVDAAAFLAAARDDLAPRSLVLACQGVECVQYAECVREVIRHARPGDRLGLGGWCLLGRAKTLLAEFFRTLRLVLPMAADAGVRHAHLFGVLWEPALGGMLWLCDRLGMTASCDSAAPVLACTRGDPRKAGCRSPNWRDNVAWWRRTLAALRTSAHYREPPRELW